MVIMAEPSLEMDGKELEKELLGDLTDLINEQIKKYGGNLIEKNSANLRINSPVSRTYEFKSLPKHIGDTWVLGRLIIIYCDKGFELIDYDSHMAFFKAKNEPKKYLIRVGHYEKPDSEDIFVSFSTNDISLK